MSAPMFWRLLVKDFRREWRSKETVQAGLVIVGLFFILFLYTGGNMTSRMGAVAVWSPVLYGTAAISGRALASEHDRGTLEWILSAPVSRALHGWSRTIVDGLVLVLLAAASLGLAKYGFGVPVDAQLLLVFLLATPGLAIMGALTGGVAAQARAREILLPLLLIPLAAPLLQAGLQATVEALAGTPTRLPLMIMAGYDLVAFGLAWILWPIVLEAD